MDEIVVAFGGGAGLAATLTAFGGMIAAILTSIATLRKMKRVGSDAKEAAEGAKIAAEQAQHNHGSSMRDEVTLTSSKIDGLAELMRSQGHQLGEIRTELAAERRDRQASDERHHDEHQRMWTAIGPH